MAEFLTQELLDSITADIPFLSRAVYLAITPSTNDALRRMADEGAPEGTLVVTDEQTAGRGRLDRKWVAPHGTSLLFSILFRPADGTHVAPLQYTMLCSLGVRDAVYELLGLRIGLKWPNDLLFQGRKFGGILAEIEAGPGGIQYVVVGIGLNVNWDPSSAAFDQPATSLFNLTGRHVPRAELLRNIAGSIAERYAALRAGKTPVAEWQSALDTVGKAVVVDLPGQRLEGMAIGVDADGALLVRAADGGIHQIVAGDVRVRSVPVR